MNKIRIVIADEDAMIRQGLKQILELEEDIIVVAQASNGESAVKMAREYWPDIILMDINMPEKDGIQVIKQIKDEGVPSRIIVLTVYGDKDNLLKVSQIGIQGYVLKDTEPGALVKAVRTIYKDKSLAHTSITKEPISGYKKALMHGGGRESGLTSRELEVLGLIAEGMINKEIAKNLFISEKTVKNHISNIFRKLDVSDRTQAAIYAFKNNMTN